MTHFLFRFFWIKCALEKELNDKNAVEFYKTRTRLKAPYRVPLLSSQLIHNMAWTETKNLCFIVLFFL